MTQSLSSSQQQRFRKLLTLAAESPFAGEREAALAAAERMADSAGMDLEEAARACGRQEEQEREAAGQSRGADEEMGPGWTETMSASMRRAAWAGYAWEAAASRARQHHREEVARRQREEEAQRRADSKRGQRNQPRSDRSMPRGDFARVLLLETGLPLRDIAEITDLGMNELVGLKLKLRREIGRQQARRRAEQARAAARSRSPA